ncbi:MAG: MATE family efflux transporter, partial [Coprococcus sp.]
AVPMKLGQIAQQLYSFTDSAIVGNYVSSQALAAVGATSVISNMIIGFLNSGTMGLAIPIAKYYGAKDYHNMRRCIGASAIMTLLASIVLTVLSLIFIRPILVLLKTPDDILDMAASYVIIIIVGIIFCSLYNLCANILRAVGDSKTPLIFLGISVVLNIVLDLMFIRAFDMGVRGAAIATDISQALAGILALIYILVKAKHLIPEKDEYSVEKSDRSDLIQSALAMGFMSCIVNIGTVILQRAINGLGTDIVTAHTAARKIFDILMFMLYIVGNAVTTYVSQNMGAGRYDRVHQGVRAAIIINTIITTVMIIFGWLLSPALIKLVAGTSASAIIDPAVVRKDRRDVLLCTWSSVRSEMCNAGNGQEDRSSYVIHYRIGWKGTCGYDTHSKTWISRSYHHRAYHLVLLYTDALHNVSHNPCGEAC